MTDKDNNDRERDRGAPRAATRGGLSRPGAERRRSRPHQARGEPASGTRASVEASILETLSNIERPLTRGEFADIAEGFRQIAARLKPLSLESIDALAFDPRTHLFTALLRAGRLPAPDEADRAAQRKQMLAAVGDVWLAVGDEARADEVYEAAGRPERAIARLEREGDWREAAALAERVGGLEQAARILRAHGDKARALALFQQAGAKREALELALELGRHEEVRALAKEVDFKAVRALLFQHDMADLYLELVAEMGDWREVARLYEQAGQHEDAGRAYERAGIASKAIEAFRRAGLQDEVLRLVRGEAAARQQRGDLAGAGNFLCRFGLLDEAVELARAPRPELAFKWLERAGQIERARAFAAEMVEQLEARGEKLLIAIWLERSEEKARAAEVWRALGRFDEVLRIYAALCDWPRAAEAALAIGDFDRAADFHARAGLPIPEALVQNLHAASALTDPAKRVDDEEKAGGATPPAPVGDGADRAPDAPALRQDLARQAGDGASEGARGSDRDRPAPEPNPRGDAPRPTGGSSDN